MSYEPPVKIVNFQLTLFSVPAYNEVNFFLGRNELLGTTKLRVVEVDKELLGTTKLRIVEVKELLGTTKSRIIEFNKEVLGTTKLRVIEFNKEVLGTTKSRVMIVRDEEGTSKARIIKTIPLEGTSKLRIFKQDLILEGTSKSRILVIQQDEGTTKMRVAYKILYINDVEYTDNVMNWNWTDELNKINVAEIKLSGITYDNANISIDKEIKIYDKGLKFFGIVRNVRRSEDDVVEVTGKTYDVKLQDRKLYNSGVGNYTTVWDAVRTDDVIPALIAGQSVVIAGTVWDNGSDFDIKNENADILSTVRKLAEYGLGDYYVERDE